MSVELLRKCCMSRCLLVLVLLIFSAPLFAQSVVTLSEDGKQAWYTPSGMSIGILADRIIRLSGDSPDDPDDPPVDPPTNPDQWGLVALSESEAQSVQGDPNRNETASKLSAVYLVTGKQFQDGNIEADELKPLLELAFQFAVGGAEDAWIPWQEATRDKYKSIGFTDVEKAGQGIIDIGIGVGRTSTAAIADWLEWFLKLMPFLLQLIELFGGAELDALLSGEGV